MTQNRFDEILSKLHFNDNTTAFPATSPHHNKLHKIQTIANHFKSKFKDTIAPETFQATDEMMVPFKGKHRAKMYMPKKPTMWGYKLWCRAGISGYLYDFEVVGGMGPTGTTVNIQSTHTFGKSENMVLCLANELSPKKHKIFFDNLFASSELLIQLKSMGIYSLGTLR